ncbi:MAG TPA: hypothetical protein VGB16_03950, partial [candidate division Zixibacteria bacterium]
PLADVGKKQVEVPKHIASKGPEAIREYLEAKQPKDEPSPSETPEEEPNVPIPKDETTAAETEEKPQAPSLKEKSVDERVQEQKQAIIDTKKASREHYELEDKENDRTYKISKITEKEVRGKTVHKFYYEKDRYLSGANIDAILRGNINEEEKKAAKAAKEAGKAEKNAARKAADTKRTEQKERYEAGKTRLGEGLEESVENQREFLRAGHDIGYELRRGKEALTFEKYDPEVSNPFVFRDPNGNRQYLHENDVDRLIKRRFEKENKEIVAELKPESRAKEITGEGLETAGKGAKALIETAEKNPVGRFLMGRAKAYLEHINPKDKEQPYYWTGFAFGFGSNIALSLFAPVLPMLTKPLRSAIFSGGVFAISRGVNLFLTRNLEKIGNIIGADNNFVNDWLKTLNKARQLEAEGKIEDSIELRNQQSKDSFLKAGYKERSDYWAWTQDIGRAAMIARIEQEVAKYTGFKQKLNHISAGFAAGNLGATGFLGLENLFSEAFKKMPHLGLFGGGDEAQIGAPEGAGPEVPHHAPTPGAPEHTPTPGVPEHTPTPTPGEIPEGPGVEPTPGVEPGEVPTEPGEVPIEPGGEPIPVPIPPEAPPMAIEDIITNPEYSSAFEIPDGATPGQVFLNNGFEDATLWEANEANAHLFGAHVEANYDMLEEMSRNVAASGIPVEDFPASAEIPGLIEAASAGDAEAMHRLTEALHYWPAGDDFNLLTPEGVQVVNKALAARI